MNDSLHDRPAGCICLPDDPFDTCPIHGRWFPEWTDDDTIVLNTADLPFSVRYVPTGEAYGRTGSLVADKPMVEFYDRRYRGGPTRDPARGQFVSRYYADTLLGRDKSRSADGGLNLDGGTAEWAVDAVAMDYVRAWLIQRERVVALELKDNATREVI